MLITNKFPTIEEGGKIQILIMKCFAEITNDDENHGTVYVSLGAYCKTAWLFKELGLKTESHPFDWMLSCPQNIMQIVEDDFQQFLNPDNYEKVFVGTREQVCGTRNIIYHPITKNTFFPNYSYDHMHHDLVGRREDLEYLKRCVERFRSLGARHNKIIFVLIQPLYRTNSTCCMDTLTLLEQILVSKFGKDKVRIVVFNIEKKNSKVESHTYRSENLQIHILKTQIIKGPENMDYFDKNGVQTFENIIKDAAN